ncbi:MAG: stage III sporulation protein AG [Lachnospiraceae bacterium]|nr:stage III sporulation protein AG [Lachnospiraceae bacterium]
MKVSEKKNQIISFVKRLMEKRQTWAIVLIIGLLLAVIVWPTNSGDGSKKDGTHQAETPLVGTDELTYEEKLEEKLASILSRVRGAGKVTVMITLESSSELVLQKDETKNTETIREKDSAGGIRDSSTTDYSSSTVQAGAEGSPYVIKEINPKVSGVLVLAKGAGSAAVKNEIYEAVEALFNLEVHKIKVLEAE